MLKFENLATVGDRIRAYDFRGNREAFIQGTVVNTGWMPNGALGYTIQIEKDGVQESFGREGDVGYVAFETSFFEYDQRVELA
jgi:hypothetical protein